MATQQQIDEQWVGSGVEVTVKFTLGYDDIEYYLHRTVEIGDPRIAPDGDVIIYDAADAKSLAQELMAENLEHASEEHRKRFRETLPDFEITKSEEF